MDLSDLMRMAASSQSEKESTTPIDDDAAVLRLREAGERYARMYRGERPKVGDLITPLSDSVVKKAGRPHLVVESPDVPLARNLEGYGDNKYGTQPDIRVICVTDDCISPFWVESAQFIPWEPSR